MNSDLKLKLSNLKETILDFASAAGAILFIGALSAAVIVAVGAVTGLIGGFVIMKLWGWFVVPLGLKAIGIAQAAGLSLIATLLNYHDMTGLTPEKKNVEEKWTKKLQPMLTWALTFIAALLIGGLIHLLFM